MHGAEIFSTVFFVGGVILISLLAVYKINKSTEERERLNSLSAAPSTLLPEGAVNDINSGKLPVYDPPAEIILSQGENCHFVDNATMIISSVVTTGYEGGSAGYSVRIAKGVSIRESAHRGHAVRQNVNQYIPGRIYLTNKRVIFRALQDGFDKKLNKLTSIVPISGGMQLQFGNTFFSLLTPMPESFFLAIKLLTYEG